ncbi:MAG: lytic transglycosylase domain-containing protein [Saprospiraceae bacterium]
MTTKHLNLYSLALASLLTVAFFTSYSSENQANSLTSNRSEDARLLPQMVKSPDLDRAFSFAGEALPMENFDVRERLDRELTSNSYFHSSTLLNLKKAAKYFPVIEPILAEAGIPDDLKYIAVAESGLTNATSPAGAKGFWQFMKGTGAEYGLEINSEVDERYHLAKATRAACKYLQKLKDRHGNWSLAAAAYNMGGGRLNSEMEKQRADNYYDLNLNQETMRYVFRIVAIKTILEDPSKFGFYLEEKDAWKPLPDAYEVEVTGAIENLGDFASKYGTTYRMLKIYNPWLKSSKLVNARRKTYLVKIPRQKF